jgi:hypothetical protein
MTATQIYRQAAALGLRLESRGNNLAVIPGRLCPADFAAELRQHKAELLDLLQAKADNLLPDCAPWLHVARQILAGEFDGADKSTFEAVTIGLRRIWHPLCQEALARLPKNTQKPAAG